MLFGHRMLFGHFASKKEIVHNARLLKYLEDVNGERRTDPNDRYGNRYVT